MNLVHSALFPFGIFNENGGVIFGIDGLRSLADFDIFPGPFVLFDIFERPGDFCWRFAFDLDVLQLERFACTAPDFVPMDMILVDSWWAWNLKNRNEMNNTDHRWRWCRIRYFQF